MLELNVHSLHDLTLLSDEELHEVLSDPKRVSKFRAELTKMARVIPSHLLVGQWLDVQGFGPGKVEAFHKVANSLMYDSLHSIAFAAEQEANGGGLALGGGGGGGGGGGKGARASVARQVLLRRRKHLRWNGGARFVILTKEPSANEVSMRNNKRMLPSSFGAPIWEPLRNARAFIAVM